MAGPAGVKVAKTPARKAPRAPRERLPLSGGPAGGKPGGARKLKAHGKSALRSCARLFSVMLMLLIHAGLLLWASLMVVGVRHKVDVTGGYISVNEALQVFGPEMQASGTTLPTARARQAHVRIAVVDRGH